jgi:hypothetical protein
MILVSARRYKSQERQRKNPGLNGPVFHLTGGFMDIKGLYTVEKHEAGAEVRITSPVDGDLTDFYILVQGVDSKAYRSAVRAYQRRLLAEQEGGEAELLAAVTIGWRGLNDGKAEVEFSREKAVQLYENSPNVANQIDRFIADRKNFTKG